ncbi:MAG TPA: acyl-CoA dehydrogenase family protein [Calditrichia bacterium]|nr:acyl-CoA dehydrogenase family protein [Calditrichota bacterium]HQU70714.1 acyl-CoA dehydrogenase family protein [Calditrichia bacterium]HQV32363.1 acyl-CoA dehydrogenase family protein [Calditrichia bacterium]
MDFKISEEQLSIRTMVREFCEEEITPNILKYDEEKAFPEHLIAKMGELGLLGIIFPEAVGGAGMGYEEYALIIEELSAADPSIGLTVAAHNSLGTNHIYTYGNEEQRARVVSHLTQGKSLASWALTEPGGGSDAFGLKTNAVKSGDHWILNGSKTFITNPNYSDYHVVMARTNPEKGKAGISAFIVEKGMPGFTVGQPMNKLGMRASDTAELFFEDVKIPQANLLGPEGQGYFNALGILDGGRISIAAMCVGIARGAFEHAVRYSQERTAFGRQIHQYQAIKIKLADMATRIDAARLLVMRAASLKDQGQKVNLESAMAKLYASEVAVWASNEAVQIFGGYGYIKEYPVEKYYRDSKLGTIGEGTSEIIRMVIARDIVKMHAIDAPEPEMV